MATRWNNDDVGAYTPFSIRQIAEAVRRAVSNERYKPAAPRHRGAEVASDGVVIQEHVLIVPAGLRDHRLDIVVFTSCRLSDGWTRDVGRDRVRICYRWQDGRTEWWSRIRRHNRTPGCLANVQHTVMSAQFIGPHNDRHRWETREALFRAMFED